MRVARVWVIVAALIGLAVAAGCARTYEIRLTRPLQVGAKYRLEGTGEIAQDMRLSADGKMVQQEKSAVGFEMDARVRALAVDEMGVETAVSITIRKCVRIEDGKRTELLAKGTVVSGRVEEGGEIFEVKGGVVAPEVYEALDLFVRLGTGGATDDEVFGTSERVRVGESWLVNAALAAADARDNGMHVHDEDVGGYMTLEEVVSAEGVECLRLRGVLTEAGVLPPGLPQGMEARNGDLRIDVWGLFPVDNAKMQRVSSVKQTLKVTAVGPIGEGGQVMTVDLMMRRGSSMKLSPVEELK